MPVLALLAPVRPSPAHHPQPFVGLPWNIWPQIRPIHPIADVPNRLVRRPQILRHALASDLGSSSTSLTSRSVSLRRLGGITSLVCRISFCLMQS
jgi:hypothetical protein